MKCRLGILGGSFNPPHVGHLMIAEGALEALKLEKVLFIPAPRPPHKSPESLLSASRRTRMLRLAIEGNDRFEISDIELRGKGPSYTVDTIRKLHARYGDDARLFLLLGSDSIANLTTWKDAAIIAALCDIVPVMRPGVRTDDEVKHLAEAVGEEKAREIRGRFLRIPLVDVSSSDIRKRIASGRSIRYLVPESVRRYVEKHKLYR